ncbi:MAG: hypothetical protein KKF27_21335 [Gammaproteobacteria bacterium]|nr:hypothetical protein [Gammaproteobacteria bacterium]
MTVTFTSPEREPYLVLGQEIMRRVYSEESPEELNAWLSAQVRRLSGAGHENARLSWEESFALYEQIMAKRAALAALPEAERKLLTWPWASWSKHLDPLEPGMLAVLAAGDGMGKTLVSECISEHWAKGGRNVVFLHFELNRAIMLDRRMVRHSGITRRNLKLGTLTTGEQDERERADERLRSWPGGITYVHCPGWTAEKALAEVRALIAAGQCDVFVIDYLEKAAASPSQIKLYGQNVYERETSDVEQIKSFSEQTETPVLLLAQLNKVGKGRDFADLDRTAIRGSGGKTERANVVILLHRENAESEIVHVRIDKNTIGSCGSFTQYMDAARFRLMDVKVGG